jgi:tetratricopeptide (TPR) repeat protein
MSTQPFDLGPYRREVSAATAEAREWVNLGLLWTYSFNHEEAVLCFERAVELDGDCVLAHWGIAYALGPNYNKPWEFYTEQELAQTIARAHAASARARSCAVTASPVEMALVATLDKRYQAPLPVTDLSLWSTEYAEALSAVYARFPDDLDVACLFAESLMNLDAWALWDQHTGEPTEGSRVLEAKAVLERALGDPLGRAHPGILHMYVHLMEMSSTPEQAILAADLLRDLAPDAGHLQHMPSHIDALCGDYRRVVAANSAAVEADRKFVALRGALNFYTLYRAHNLHFKAYGAMFLGQSGVALEAAAELQEALSEELLRVEVPPMADWLEGFLGVKLHVQIRFGRWEEIIATPIPEDEELYAATVAITHYAKGVAYAASGRVQEAEVERDLFAAALLRVPASRMLFNNSCLDILAVAAEMLAGELEYRRGNVERAFEHLRKSIELDDNLPYDEPWGWMQPTRHAYGALLLEQGRVAEAEAVYRADLGLDDTLPRACQHPGNVWSLHGYHECLVALGKNELAQLVEQQLKMVVAQADVPIQASCFCRVSAVEGGTAPVADRSEPPSSSCHSC